MTRATTFTFGAALCLAVLFTAAIIFMGVIR